MWFNKHHAVKTYGGVYVYVEASLNMIITPTALLPNVDVLKSIVKTYGGV